MCDNQFYFNRFIRNIQIDDIIIENSNLSNELISIKIEYTTSDGIYTVSDTLTIEV